ncbi:MAG: hypothetical protein WBG48_17725 [Pricia sp.]
MKKKKQILKATLALMLLSAFMLPVSMQFFHVFEGHQHEICTATDTHLHQDSPDCGVCDFHFAPLQYDIAPYADAVEPVVPTKHQSRYDPRQFSSPLFLNIRLRAPPYILG